MHCFVRHTRVSVPSGICYGQSDVDLADTFYQEAALVKERLQGFTFRRVYSSPLQRCTRLANYCGYSYPKTQDALMEMDFGKWEMQKWDEIDMGVWADDWVHNAPPQGESLIQMYARISAFLALLPKDENILLFTHKGVINCAKVFYKDVALTAIFDEPLDYGQMLVFS